MSEEPRSPDEPQMPSGSDPKTSPAPPAPSEAGQPASEEASAEAAPELTEAEAEAVAPPSEAQAAPSPEPVGATTEPASEAPSEPAPATPAEPTAETPSETAPATPAEPGAETPSETAPATAAEPVAETPSETAPATAAEPGAETPSETAPATAAEPGAEAQATPAAESPAKAGSGTPAEAAAETPEAKTTETPSEPVITTPEEAEAFVRSVRAEVPTTLPETLAKGQTVRGMVKALEEEDAILDVSEGRFECRLPKLDFVDASGKVSLAQGDAVDLVLEELGDPPVFKRRSNPIGEAIGKIAEAFAGRLPLEGKITSSIKGGFEVKLQGLRAFLPGSQATLRRSDDKSLLVGKTLPLMVTKFDPSGRSIVVSRRKILDKERKQEARQTRENLTKGAKFSGRVVALQAYGAFIDIGGLQGLLHLTEISWSRLRKPDDALKVGQRIDVVVLEHDAGGKKISLSMRALLEDPWKALGGEVQPNQVRQGKILRIVKSGAIVELAPGVEARLAPAEFSPDGQVTPERKKQLIGNEFAVQVVDFDAKRHRCSLLAAPEGAEVGSIVAPPEVKAGAKIKGMVERAAPFGLFVRLAPGKTGLLHATESNTPPGTDLGKEFPPGSPLQVEVIEVNEEEGRIRLTRRTAFDRMKDRERQQARQGRGGPRRDGPGGGRGGDRRGGKSSGPMINPASAPKGGGFASFGDALKSAFGTNTESAPVETPAEAPVEKPAEPTVEAPAETVAEAAASEAPSEAEAPVETPAETPAEATPSEVASETEAQVETPAETPAEATPPEAPSEAEAQTETSAETPAEEPTPEPPPAT